MNSRSLLLPLALAACTQTVLDAAPPDEDNGVETPGLTCAPGEPVYCRCDDGAAGAATCLSGNRRGACHCDDPSPPRPPLSGELPQAPTLDTPECSASRDGCYIERASAPLCPCARVRSDPARPAWRITSLRVTAPRSIAAGSMGAELTRATLAGHLLLGVEADLVRATVRLGRLDPREVRMGAVGLGLLDASYQFSSGNLPPNAPIALTRGTFSTTRALGALALPVEVPGRADAVDLPLCDVQLRRVPLTEDLGCIGAAVPTDGAFDECHPAWDPTDGGELTAAITVSQAEAISLDDAGTTLCALLAGADCVGPPSRWRAPPDSFACGDSAWTLTARFSAVSANIAR